MRRTAVEKAGRLREVADWTLPAAELAADERFASRKAEVLGPVEEARLHGWVG